MANIFYFILIIVTLIAGLLWLLNRFAFTSKEHDHQIDTRMIATNNQINNKNLKNLFSKSDLMRTWGESFPTLAIVLIVRLFIYEPFQIPSGSMMPTLLIGDFILVKKFAYGIKDPFFRKTLIKIGYPKRGDIVVFKYPKDSRLDYIKRAVGLPGDKVIYNPITKKITIKTGCNPNDSCKDSLFITYSNVEPSDFVQTFCCHNRDEIISKFFQVPKSETRKNSIRLIERKETLGNVTQRILTMPISLDKVDLYYHQPGQQLATWIVPPCQYFVMGDNRDNSADSRYWGFVPEENLVGKATVIWLSFEKQQGEWPTGIRLNRIGKIY